MDERQAKHALYHQEGTVNADDLYWVLLEVKEWGSKMTVVGNESSALTLFSEHAWPDPHSVYLHLCHPSDQSWQNSAFALTKASWRPHTQARHGYSVVETHLEHDTTKSEPSSYDQIFYREDTDASFEWIYSTIRRVWWSVGPCQRSCQSSKAS